MVVSRETALPYLVDNIKVGSYFILPFCTGLIALVFPFEVIILKFYSQQLMHFFIKLCISLLSYIKIT